MNENSTPAVGEAVYYYDDKAYRFTALIVKIPQDPCSDEGDVNLVYVDHGILKHVEDVTHDECYSREEVWRLIR